MSYIGNSSTFQTVTPGIDYFSGNASTTTFQLTRQIVAVQDILVYIDNVPQNPSTAYSINTATNQITFTSAPLSGTNNIWVYYNTKQIQMFAPAQGTVGNTALATGAFSNITGVGTLSSLTVTNDASISGLTVGKGGGSVADNTAFGNGALASNTTGADNAAFGYLALNANTTGTANAAFGRLALSVNTGTANTGLGNAALYQNTTGGGNSGVGSGALLSNTTGSNNTSLGTNALNSNTTASNNTAVGYQAGYTNATGPGNTFVGYQAGYSYNGSTGYNICVGAASGYNLTSGSFNTFIGSSSGVPSGYYVTTGSKNVILGGYSGNQGGLDIRTASNYIVLSDGDGNPRQFFDGSGNLTVGTFGGGDVRTNGGFQYAIGSSSYADYGHGSTASSGSSYFRFWYNASQIGSITQNGTTAVAYNTSSDYRLKENVAPMTGALATVQALKPVTYDWISDKSKGQGFIAHELQAVVPDCVSGEKDAVDEEGKPVYQGIDTSFLVATLTAAIQELKADNDSMRAALKAAGIAGF